jgi:hypothetical protein
MKIIDLNERNHFASTRITLFLKNEKAAAVIMMLLIYLN